ncbi:MAG: TIM barrel protein [Akkermansiaceae bacterium]|nr:TIM barrel protein [Akkermansiaceae bacterium]MDG1362064.1 TIM barrel protein [Akkermansiaceae bacterium]
MQRRHFIHTSFAALTTAALADHHGKHPTTTAEDLFKISLAQWSNHRALKGGKMTNMDWPEYTKKTYNILALEYVNQFFKDKANDNKYLGELNKRVSDLGMTNVLIMVDGEGHIGAGSDQKRQKTIDNHKKWVEAAKRLGCHSIRVNSHGEGNDDAEKAANCVKGLSSLSTFAQDHQINIIVENHGGLSSNGAWMSKVLKDVGLDNCGSLPDFGNFHGYDRYKGLKELMPFAKGVSAKSHEFDDKGEETKTDFTKALGIVLDHDYHGWVGVEYEGRKLSEDEGIKATKALLEKSRATLHTKKK